MRATLLVLMIVVAFAPARALGACGSGGCSPPPLSDAGSVDLGSSYGGGSFGRWQLDSFGLPEYLYTANEATDPHARQAELGGATRAQHQVGNDHIVAAGFNDGYTQLWSQDRLMQWANLFEPTSRHYAGGFGWLRIGGRVLSTLYLDRPRGSSFQRQFGVGYYHKRLQADGVQITQVVYAPFGDDPAARRRHGSQHLSGEEARGLV